LFPFEPRAIELDGLRYAYVDCGQGETLLCVHGNPTWSFYWRELIRALSPNCRVIAVDHIGCGRSDKPRDYPYRLAQHVDNLSRFVERLDLRDVTLLGHDWGGAIGLGAALAQPERFGRFVMFNTAAFRSRRMPWRIRACRVPLAGRLTVQGLNGFARAALRMAVCKRERMTPAVRAGLLAPYDSWRRRQAIYRFVEDIPLSPRHPSYATLSSIEERLPQLADRAWMFVWGMRDWCFTPAFLEQFLSYYPTAEVHRIADAGHYVLEDAHERIVPLVERFLAKHPLAAVSRRE
jgi:haloalkane dehalogenase